MPRLVVEMVAVPPGVTRVIIQVSGVMPSGITAIAIADSTIAAVKVAIASMVVAVAAVVVAIMTAVIMPVMAPVEPPLSGRSGA
jgi:hypothetical protein